MKSLRYFIIMQTLLFSVLSCSNQVKETVQVKVVEPYQNQIGDTPFDSKFDDPDFKLCDPSDVLHKRAFVRYEGGKRAYNKELSEKYKFKSSYKSFTGYFIVRFVVNCNDESDRFRIETHNANFELTKSPEGLERHILAVSKSMTGWKHPFYDNKEYDGYCFFIVKMINGQIQ